MSHDARLPPRGRSGTWILPLGIALLLAIQPIWRDGVAVAVAGGLFLTLLAAARWELRWLPVLVLVACGVILRLANWGVNASDVDDVTRAAIQRFVDGLSPYGLGYMSSIPYGAGWPYGPVAIAWYLPSFRDPKLIELVASAVILVVLAIRAGRGRPLGLAVYALAPPLVLAAVDGSNDTSAGLLILAALVAADRKPLLGAGILAVAVAFKPYALAWLPPLVALGGLPTVGVFGLVSVVAWSPVLLGWGIPAYLYSLELAAEAHRRAAYWSLAAILDGVIPGGAPRLLETLRYGFAAVGAAIGFRYVRRSRPTIDGVILAGTATFVVAQFGGYFGSYVYLAALAPILCWRVDDWFGRLVVALANRYGHGERAERQGRIRKPGLAAVPTRPVAGRTWVATASANDGFDRARARSGSARETASGRPRGRSWREPRNRAPGFGRLPGL